MDSEQFIIDMMQEKMLLTEEQVRQIKAKVEADGGSMLDALYNLKICTEQDVVQMLASEYGMETYNFDASDKKIPDEVVNLLPGDIAMRYRVMPISLNNNVLRVAMEDPGDMESLDAVRYLLKMDVEAVVAPKRQIEHAINTYYGTVHDEVGQFLQEITENTIDITRGSTIDATGEIEDVRATGPKSNDETPIIRLVSLLILEAFRTRASDIHVEPLEKRFRIRYRIDGVLNEMQNPPKYLQNQIISRLKLMAGMDLSEHRIPQDGRIKFMAMGRDLDLRVSDIPTTAGESIVMRILDKSGVMLGISELGFMPDDEALINKIIKFPDGIFLVTGPTGSGKTTSLYSFLHALNQPVSKIITAEDPVEYEMSGINQVQINPDVDLTFANALRAMLRQAPNIIMAGEIRDTETGEIAINAALTGHLVFSTLHTNDAPSAITRLINMGIKPFLIASSLRAIMAQRLVRRLCKNCSTPHEITDAERDQLNLDDALLAEVRRISGLKEGEEMVFKEAVGCPECKKGYRGRMGIYEIFVLDQTIEHLIYGYADASAIRAHAIELGMRSLRLDGLRKAAVGLPPLTEVIRLTVGDKS